MRDMSRTFFLISAADRQAAVRTVAAASVEPDICVISPSATARATAVFAVSGRRVFTLEEPLLAERSLGESGDDVLARLAQALRGISAYDAQCPLIVIDRLDILGATAFVLDETGLMGLADNLERALPVQ